MADTICNLPGNLKTVVANYKYILPATIDSDLSSIWQRFKGVLCQLLEADSKTHQ